MICVTKNIRKAFLEGIVTRYKLTWREKDQRWQKMYKGRLLYFPGRGGKLASYQAALQAFNEAKAKIDAEELSSTRTNSAIEMIEAEQARLLQDHFDSPEVREHWQALEASKAYLSQREHLGPESLEQKASDRIQAYDQIYWHLTKQFLHGTLDIPPPEPPPGSPPWVAPPSCIADLVKAFMDERRLDVEIGKLSMARLANQRVHLASLMKHLGPGSSIEKLDSQCLDEFRAAVKGDLARRAISPSTARDRLHTTKQFVYWAYDNEKVKELPRCLRKYSLAIETTEPETIPNSDIQALYQSANDRQKLYLLLGLNCGFTVGDIANLAISEVDIEGGTITRRRSKTKRHKSVPTVVYHLWPETLALVSKHLQKSGTLAFLTERGKPLIQQELTPDGALKKTDTIHSSWVRLQKSSGIKQSHKLLRKTGASMLFASNEFSRFVGTYLGHSPKGVAEKSYVKQDKTVFRDAVAWLRDQFDLD